MTTVKGRVVGPRFPTPGGHTAYGPMLDYRLAKLQERGILHGDWLDCGCAQGYYAAGLAERGASSVVGVDAIAPLVAQASERPHPSTVTFQVAQAEQLPFGDDRFDGVLLNEVLEHVTDEAATLKEVARVLRPGGHLALFSPNRWFPFEGHGARLFGARIEIHGPVPLMSWLPARVSARYAKARNYWPRQLRGLITDAGLEVVESAWALPQFAQYPWMPTAAIRRFRRSIPRLERSPVARFAAVSTFIVARAP
jgi:SAM-dependent methyltransferase